MKMAMVSLTGAVVLLTLITSIAAQEGKEVKIKVSQLPSAVAQAIKTNCADCSIDKASRETENGVTVYDVEFKGGKGEIALAEDGTVVDRETIVALNDVPDAAREVIQKAATGGKIKQVSKDEIRADLKNGRITKLDTPRYVYEAELVKGNQRAEIEVSADGRVIEQPQWGRKGEKNN